MYRKQYSTYHTIVVGVVRRGHTHARVRPANGRGLLAHPLTEVVSSGALVYAVVGPAQAPGVVRGVFLRHAAGANA